MEQKILIMIDLPIIKQQYHWRLITYGNLQV